MAEYSTTSEILIRLPKQMLKELDGFVEQENMNRNEFIYRATRMYLRDRKNRLLQESMRRGYMEMAKINLAISCEACQAEYEAADTVERLVSGG